MRRYAFFFAVSLGLAVIPACGQKQEEPKKTAKAKKKDDGSDANAKGKGKGEESSSDEARKDEESSSGEESSGSGSKDSASSGSEEQSSSGSEDGSTDDPSNVPVPGGTGSGSGSLGGLASLLPGLLAGGKLPVDPAQLQALLGGAGGLPGGLPIDPAMLKQLCADPSKADALLKNVPAGKLPAGVSADQLKGMIGPLCAKKP